LLDTCTPATVGAGVTVSGVRTVVATLLGESVATGTLTGFVAPVVEAFDAGMLVIVDVGATDTGLAATLTLVALLVSTVCTVGRRLLWQATKRTAPNNNTIKWRTCEARRAQEPGRDFTWPVFWSRCRATPGPSASLPRRQ